LIFDGVGAVTDFTPAQVQVGGDAWSFTIPLAEAGYSFSDPREIPVASVREAEAARYEFGLAINLAGGDRLVLMELKAPEQIEEEPE
jgi:hypothetical protein